MTLLYTVFCTVRDKVWQCIKLVSRINTEFVYSHFSVHGVPAAKERHSKLLCQITNGY